MSAVQAHIIETIVACFRPPLGNRLAGIFPNVLRTVLEVAILFGRLGAMWFVRLVGMEYVHSGWCCTA